MKQIDDLIRYIETHALRGDANSVIAAVDRFSGKNRGLMHIGARKGAVLDNALAARKPERVLELGSFFGYSALRTARLLPSGGELITVDADPDHHRATKWLVDYAGVGNKVSCKLGRAADVIGQLNGSFDVVFIDHYANNYLHDLSLLEQAGMLRPGALVITDNVVMFESALEPYLQHLRARHLLQPVSAHGVVMVSHTGALSARRRMSRHPRIR